MPLYAQGDTDTVSQALYVHECSQASTCCLQHGAERSRQRWQHLIVVRKLVELPPPRVPQLGEAVQEQHQRLALSATRGDCVEPACRGHGEHGAQVSHALGAADHHQPPAPENCRAQRS